MPTPLPTSLLVENAKSVIEIGLNETAMKYGIKYHCVINRTKQLEKRVGYRIFAPYDYEKLTWQGNKLLKSDQESKEI